MVPVLFSIGSVKIYTYGVFLVLAFFWGLFFIWKAVRLTSYKEEVIFDGIFFSLLGALFFSRLFYVIANFSSFGFSFLKFILINGYPGLSFYGALFGGLLFFFLFSLVKKLNFIQIVDYLIPGVFVALGFGKLGAFFSGSEIGTKTKFFFGVNYLGYEGLRHAVGLYEALIFFICAYFSYKILFKIRREELPEGANLFFLFWASSGVYFFTDPFKKSKFYFLGFNFNYWFSFLLWLTTSLGLVYYFRIKIISFLKTFLQNAKLFIQRGVRKISKKIAKRKKENRGGNSEVEE